MNLRKKGIDSSKSNVYKQGLGAMFSLLLPIFAFLTLYPTQIPLPKISTSVAAVQLPVPEPTVEIREISMVVGRISFYNPVPRQTDADPEISSCGPTTNRQIALSQDLFFDSRGVKHLCGETVTVVTDRGEVFHNYVINDTMNVRYRGAVDVMLPHTDEAQAFGLGVTQGYIVFH